MTNEERLRDAADVAQEAHRLGERAVQFKMMAALAKAVGADKVDLGIEDAVFNDLVAVGAQVNSCYYPKGLAYAHRDGIGGDGKPAQIRSATLVVDGVRVLATRTAELLDIEILADATRGHGAMCPCSACIALRAA